MTDELIVYPNPAKTGFSVSLQGGKIVEVVVTDVQGNVVRRSKHPEGTIFTDLSPGVYFIQVKTTEGGINRRVVVD